MKKRYRFGVGFICFLLFSSVVYGMEPSLEMKVSQEEIMLNETVNIVITAKDIDGIAGSDILLYYDKTKLKLIVKEIKLEQSDRVDLQEIITGIEDVPGKARIYFGLKKDKPLLRGAEKILATLAFEAIGMGNAEIKMDPTSQLVKEIVHETEISYDYASPVLSPPKQIRIIIPNTPVPEEPNDNPSDDPTEGSNESPNDDGSIDEPNDESDENDNPPKDAVDRGDRLQDSLGNNGDKLMLQALDIHSIDQNGLKLCGSIYWIDNPNVLKEITLPYHGDDLNMKRLGIYYYHEKKQKWIYLGGKVHGNTLTVSLINHNINFNKLAVLEDRTYPGFTDIVGEDMSADLVKVLTLGIIKGYEDLTLRLDQTMSREEWITAFILALDTPLKEGEDDLSFEEVSPWAQAYIRTALALELIGDTSVRGHERLMAKEAVEMLDKAVSRMAELEEKKVFRLEEEIEGDPLLTRRQAVQLLAQLLKYLYV